jgi:hypothetical protein
MQEKAPYVSKAEKLKVEYTKKMDAYNNKQVHHVPLHSHCSAVPRNSAVYDALMSHASSVVAVWRPHSVW